VLVVIMLCVYVHKEPSIPPLGVCVRAGLLYAALWNGAAISKIDPAKGGGSSRSLAPPLARLFLNK
jgi:hypothetical protein